MPIERHILLTYKGDFADGAARPMEVWQFGLRFPRLDGASTDATIAEAVDNASEAAALWTTHLAEHHHPRIRLRGVRASYHVAGGKTDLTADGQYVQGDWAGQVNATGGTATQYPLQTAAVASLMTNRAGASGRGRIFLPQLRYPMDDQWGFSETNRVAVATSVANLLVALRPVVGAAAVYSTKGFNSPVTFVRVGSVPDTQRSRRGNLEETYSGVTLPP